MGNRGCIHRGHAIARQWATTCWITCALEYKGWVAPKWVPGRWTALFFYDEALSLAAGHRPCALCRREDYNRYLAAAGLKSAAEINARLHAERVDRQRKKRKHRLSWRDLPAGAYAEVDGLPHVVLADAIRPWDVGEGYGPMRARPPGGDAIVLTPPLSVRALVSGYAVQISE